MSASNFVHIEVDEILKDTENAFLVLYNEEEIWLPKSQVSDWRDYVQGDRNVTLSITKWIASTKGIDTE